MRILSRELAADCLLTESSPGRERERERKRRDGGREGRQRQSESTSSLISPLKDC